MYYRRASELDGDNETEESPQQSSLSGFTFGAPDPVTPLIGGLAHRLEREWNAVIEDQESWGWGSRARTAKGTAGLVMMFGVAGVILATMGVGANPITGEVMGSPIDAAALTLGSTISAGQLLWADYRARIEDIEFREWIRRKLL